MPLENVVPQEVTRWLGLNSKQSRAKLAPGFSPSSGDFFNIDLSTPGRATPRGGSAVYASLGADVPTRLFNYYNGATGTNYMLSSAGAKLYQITTGKIVSTLSSAFTAGWIGDFLNYGTQAFITSPTDTPQIYDGATLRKWGIVAPTVALTSANGAVAVPGLTGAYQYKFTYVNSTSGHESNASPASIAVTAAGNNINLSVISVSSDPQVNYKNIYRTTAGGAYYFYVGQIANATTTYTDTTADTLLGITEAPLNNYPPQMFQGIEEWNGRIWGFLPNSTILSFSNDGYYTPVGNGNPWEAFAGPNTIDFKAQVFGIRKSPNFNELWVHTANGVYAVVPTYIPQNPYIPVIRNATWNACGHFNIVNIYNQQWFVTNSGKVISLDSAGNVAYESYYVEPDFGAGNVLLYSNIQAVHYRGNNKNQFRANMFLGGKTTCGVMLAANYLQRTPFDQEIMRTLPVWEYHLMNSVCMGVCKDSNNQEQLFTGWTDGNIYQQDTGTNDNGTAISWSHSVGWIRAADTAEKTALGRRVVQYYNPLGDWSWSMTTNFDFGNGGGQVYPVKAPPIGGELDVNFYLDITPLAGVDALSRVVTPIAGAYSYLELIWAGNALDQFMELHNIVLLPVQIEGTREAN
jgi:hypothetical protein